MLNGSAALLPPSLQGSWYLSAPKGQDLGPYEGPGTGCDQHTQSACTHPFSIYLLLHLALLSGRGGFRGGGSRSLLLKGGRPGLLILYDHDCGSGIRGCHGGCLCGRVRLHGVGAGKMKGRREAPGRLQWLR